MTRLPQLEGKYIVSRLLKHGFEVVRRRGSHVRLKHCDGRVTTVPVHKGSTIGKGLLRKILRDTDLTVKDIIE